MIDIERLDARLHHNHVTRTLKPVGECPACDATRRKIPSEKRNPADSPEVSQSMQDRPCRSSCKKCGEPTIHLNMFGGWLHTNAEIDLTDHLADPQIGEF